MSERRYSRDSRSPTYADRRDRYGDTYGKRDDRRRDRSRSRSRSDSRDRNHRKEGRGNYNQERDLSTYSRKRHQGESSERSDARTRSPPKQSLTKFERKQQRREKEASFKENSTMIGQQWGMPEEKKEDSEEVNKVEPIHRPDFGLSGALAKDERTGNVVNGQVLKFTEPPEASRPDKSWRFYVYKDDTLVETLHLHRRSCFLLGRDSRIADIPLAHPSISLQHAVIQFRAIDKRIINEDGDRVNVKVIKPYVMDLQSSHGTFLNGERIEDSRYYELREKDLLKLGMSTRDFILLKDEDTKMNLDDDAD